MKITSMQYSELVKTYSPNSNTLVDMLNAFWSGGLICVLGQLILNGWSLTGLSQDLSATATSMTMGVSRGFVNRNWSLLTGWQK